MYDILIIGSGPAGLTASIYAARANKKIAIITGKEAGGQLMKTHLIENYPGFAKPISGPDLMIDMLAQANSLNVQIINENALTFNKNTDYFEVHTNQEKLQTKSLIIATGASPKKLELGKEFEGKGISYCATCDGFFFKDKTVAIIGGGNTALEEAIYLSNICKKVYLIHRKTVFKGEKTLQNRAFLKQNIKVLTPFKTISFAGNKTLEQIQIENVETNEKHYLEVSGVFIAIGHIPNTKFLEGKIKLTETGYVEHSVKTEIPGLFVAGDIHDSRYRQAVTAAGYGCMAALEAISFLESF